MTSRWNIVLLIIALALSGWYFTLHQQDDASARAQIKPQDAPDYIAEQMQTTVYSIDGMKQYVADASKVTYFQHSGETQFDAPEVFLYQKNKQTGDLVKSWRLRADFATLSKDKMLYLNDNVLVQSLLPDSRIQTLKTQSAVVNITTQDITSDTIVSIYGPQFTTTGNILTGNLRQQIATLKEQVKTQYEINTQ
ncbi:LPS export ABC transporter periplasmic protein LptC [Pasteurellaceae bacterium HPA106]|uniref:LPS export ABC transporter periplasmic protein LptC n=1 Tax=Spirabiliibacterium pneumoniae TaxID=221400 RepID=UPI001AAD87DC|nr:LPS export ABC transporter periplasmic protein LptC [Spirabiliibacterium pneumoniae]MBE2896674.1 LPS export ABC transporter periplasmic protein LptC [Spirabiliibacterium pneumoniae]